MVVILLEFLNVFEVMGMGLKMDLFLKVVIVYKCFISVWEVKVRF